MRLFCPQVWFKNRRAKCRQQYQQQNSNQTSSKSSSSSKGVTSISQTNIKSSSNSKTSSKAPTSTSSLSTSQASITTSSPNLPTPTTSVSPPINVICKKESAQTFESSPLNKNNLSYNDALRLSKDSSEVSVHGYGVTPKQEHYNSPKRLDYNSKVDSYSEKTFGSSLVKDQYSSRLAGSLTPLGSNSSIMTTPSPPITPQSVNGPGSVYHPDNYNSFHWPGSTDYIRSYSSGHHHQGYGQAAYNSPYYPSQVRFFFMDFLYYIPTLSQ